MSLTRTDLFDNNNVISPFRELVAYESLWAETGSSIKKMSERLSKRDRLPSEIIVELYGFLEHPKQKEIEDYIRSKIGKFSVMLKENLQYPRKLLDAKYPIDMFYYKGDLGLLEIPSVSIVGSRKVSDEGIRRTRRLAKLLCDNGYTIVSGLARGVDTAALSTSIELGGKVIAVIGTPIDEYYPKENKELQDKIANEHLLISQVPFYKYSRQPFSSRNVYFPQRNATMAALSDATIIVEASDTSGTLTQARACVEQNRKLFILNSCFENPNISWPEKYLKKGAIRVKDINDIMSKLKRFEL